MTKCFAQESSTVTYFVSRFRSELNEFASEFDRIKGADQGQYQKCLQALEFIVIELMRLLNDEFEVGPELVYLEDSTHHAYEDRENDFVMQSAERILGFDDCAKLYETVSSVNDNLAFQSVGCLYVTNKRFVYLSDRGVSSFPFSKVVKVIDERYVENEKGRVSLSISGRARKICFLTEMDTDALCYYSYFTDSEYHSAAHNAATSEGDKAKVGEYYKARFAITCSSIEAVLKRGLRQAKTSFDAAQQGVRQAKIVSESLPSGGTGCCIPIVLIIGVIILVLHQLA